MKHIISIFTFIMFLVVVLSCSIQRNVETSDIILGTSMKYTLVIDEATYYQVDSLINADNLPDINKWIGGTFIDYETSKKITKRMFIKKQKNGETVYTVIGNSEPFNVTKRVTE